MLGRASTSVYTTTQLQGRSTEMRWRCSLQSAIETGKYRLTFPLSSASSASLSGHPVSGLAQPLLAVRRRAPPL